MPASYNPVRFLPQFLFTIFNLVLFISIASAQVPGGHFNFPPPGPKEQADLYLKMKRYRTAEKSFRSIIEKGNADGYVFRGLVQACDGNQTLGKCETYLRNYVSSQPEDANGYYGLGYCLYLGVSLEEAENYFKQALGYNPKHALALNNWGAVLAESNEFEKAVDKIKQAIETRPQETMFYLNLKKVYEWKGEPERFSKEYRSYLEDGSMQLASGYGKQLARALRQNGFREYDKGKIKLSLKTFKDMLKIYREIKHLPGEVAGLFSLGLLHEELGNKERANHYFNEVLKLNPSHIQAREKMKDSKP